jgi:hypothetical protein
MALFSMKKAQAALLPVSMEVKFTRYLPVMKAHAR